MSTLKVLKIIKKRVKELPKQNNEQRSVKLEFRSTDFESRTIDGYASTFDENYTLIQDYYGEKFYERIMPGAFSKTLLNRTDQVMLVNHDWDKVVGKRNVNLELNEDAEGLRFKLTVPNTTDGNDLLEMVRMGLIDGCSFGFRVVDEDTRWDDNWTFYRDVKEVELFEITATPFPAYASTTIGENRSLNVAEMRSKLTDKPKKDNVKSKEKRDRNAKIISQFFSKFVSEVD